MQICLLCHSDVWRWCKLSLLKITTQMHRLFKIWQRGLALAAGLFRWTNWKPKWVWCTVSATCEWKCKHSLVLLRLRFIPLKRKCCISRGSKWTISIFPLCRSGFRTVELVIRNTLAPVLPLQLWWPHFLLVNWHHPWWMICSTQPIFHPMHRSSRHLLIWMVKTWKHINVFHTRCKTNAVNLFFQITANFCIFQWNYIS